jgi:hypothetical protein
MGIISSAGSSILNTVDWGRDKTKAAAEWSWGKAKAAGKTVAVYGEAAYDTAAEMVTRPGYSLKWGAAKWVNIATPGASMRVEDVSGWDVFNTLFLLPAAAGASIAALAKGALVYGGAKVAAFSFGGLKLATSGKGATVAASSILMILGLVKCGGIDMSDTGRTAGAEAFDITAVEGLKVQETNFLGGTEKDFPVEFTMAWTTFDQYDYIAVYLGMKNGVFANTVWINENTSLLGFVEDQQNCSSDAVQNNSVDGCSPEFSCRAVNAGAAVPTGVDGVTQDIFFDPFTNTLTVNILVDSDAPHGDRKIVVLGNVNQYFSQFTIDAATIALGYISIPINITGGDTEFFAYILDGNSAMCSAGDGAIRNVLSATDGMIDRSFKKLYENHGLNLVASYPANAIAPIFIRKLTITSKIGQEETKFTISGNKLVGGCAQNPNDLSEAMVTSMGVACWVDLMDKSIVSDSDPNRTLAGDLEDTDQGNLTFKYDCYASTAVVDDPDATFYSNLDTDVSAGDN